MNLKQMQQNFANHLRHGHVWSSTVSRRHFIRTAAGAGAAGLMVSSGLFSKAFAVPSSSDPKPIPGGEQLLFPDPTVFHLHLPGFPPFPDNNPATKDPSVITDFNGDVGLAYVNGTGTHTDLVTGDETHLTFGVDLRFMKGEYVGEDGNHHHGAFALIWLDVFDQAGQQIHDFNPGISESGLFWVARIDPHDVTVNPGNGRASMDVSDLEVEDYHDLVNALLDGPSVEAEVSFRIDWTMSQDKHRFSFAPETWEANVVFNTATVQWEGRTDTAMFVSDPAATSTSLFAEVGKEHNGVFF